MIINVIWLYLIHFASELKNVLHITRNDLKSFPLTHKCSLYNGGIFCIWGMNAYLLGMYKLAIINCDAINQGTYMTECNGFHFLNGVHHRLWHV